MRKYDQKLIERIGIERVMEVVAMRTADVLVYHLKIPDSTPITVLAGKGHNGGDAICVARILHGWGRPVFLILAADQKDLSPQTQKQYEIYQSFGGQKISSLSLKGVLVDGLLGTGLKKDPKGKISELIEHMNASHQPILSLDLPSGLDATTGKAYEPCVKATWTVTYHVPKSGLLERQAKPFVGELFACESGLTYTAFPDITEELQKLYQKSPIVKIISQTTQ